MGIHEVLKDLTDEMEKDCQKIICGDCEQQVKQYVRLIRLAVKMDESRLPAEIPPVDRSKFYFNRTGLPDFEAMRKTKAGVHLLRTKYAATGGCCERFADNKGCDCMERAE